MLADRRQFLALAAFSFGTSPRLPPLTVLVRVLYDRGAHSGRGLLPAEVAKFQAYQDRARREFAVSGIAFALEFVDGAYLRQQGYSVIPDKFLSRQAINLFVTETLHYDIDVNRTGGCSMGPRPPHPPYSGNPYYLTFLGLREARPTTLPHEYAHHFCLDTQHGSGAAGNFWADLRNDYWLWRQRHGTPIPEFRACARAPWVRTAGAAQTGQMTTRGSAAPGNRRKSLEGAWAGKVPPDLADTEMTELWESASE